MNEMLPAVPLVLALPSAGVTWVMAGTVEPPRVKTWVPVALLLLESKAL